MVHVFDCHVSTLGIPIFFVLSLGNSRGAGSNPDSSGSLCGWEGETENRGEGAGSRSKRGSGLGEEEYLTLMHVRVVSNGAAEHAKAGATGFGSGGGERHH